MDASTTSLRWALELATGAGVRDAEVVAALLAAASAESAAQLHAIAGVLEDALGYSA